MDKQNRRPQLDWLEDATQQQKDALAECLDGINQQLITLFGVHREVPASSQEPREPE
jgi:hypothetical protein